MAKNSTEVINREQDFHNARFQNGDSRVAQGKFYWSIENGARRFLDTLSSLAQGADVLEYGCGDNDQTRLVAPLARSVTAIDISDVAIEHAKLRAPYSNVSYEVMDAMNMNYPTGSFDLVFGSGIIHHLDTEAAAKEISRVLRPDGVALFWEPLGVNPAINLYRAATPGARTVDEHPLLARDLNVFRDLYEDVNFEFFGLATLTAIPVRNLPGGMLVRRLLVALDSVVLRMPGVQMLAWFCLIRAQRPKLSTQPEQSWS